MFDAAARHLSCSRAAEELCLTQSAVSKQIHALEEHLGLPLFNRVHHGLELTLAGQIYWDAVKPALALLAEGTTRIRALRADDRVIHLGLPAAVGQKWLIPRLAGFNRRHPDINVEFTPRLTHDAKSGALTAEIRFGRGKWPGVRAHYLLGRELYAVGSPALLKQMPVEQPADVLRHRLLEHIELPNIWERWFAGHGVAGYDARLIQKYEQYTLMIPALTAGLGVGILPRFLVEEELRRRKLVLLEKEALRSDYGYYLVHAKDRKASDALEHFTRWLLAEAKHTPV
ncbi:LysR family transcriptional regulator [Noviherbaspirillum aridicola]|uniref:LysR family transcriptional regulator n=1 Tax=Noviherbaspirillum aridicola TaxID=2849687 RepID=A0ABQ4Q3L5_9BURK|nr:LysR family transcriptional regulator [Noviherbaspirillum aridicola]